MGSDLSLILSPFSYQKDGYRPVYLYGRIRSRGSDAAVCAEYAEAEVTVGDLRVQDDAKATADDDDLCDGLGNCYHRLSFYRISTATAAEL